MRVAIVHYWLVSMRGGERVLESLCRLFPDADLYMHVADRDAMSKTIARHRIYTTFIARLPFARRWYQRYLPLMPLALEALDLTEYDLIISNEAGPAKGIIPAPEAVHVCYACSPMRYIWDKYWTYRDGAGAITRALMLPIAFVLRIWDVVSAARVDRFMADSTYVAQRIRTFYRREAEVVFPPVAVEQFAPVPADEIGDYYLWAGELVRYKRPDIAIEAFRRNGRRLILIGEGAEMAGLRRKAPDNITFLGKVPFTELKRHMARCRALVFPGDEDFGIIPVEIQASGRPVIALGRGGALDTVVDGETGLLYRDGSAEGLVAAIERFEESGLAERCRDACVANASRFTERAFHEGVLRVLHEAGITELPAVPESIA
jgi:glycosyltransferase involved in cell wall biosynthesis